MNYINAYDAITGESILHDQQVRACILINDSANLEHDYETFIPHMSRKEHKLAAFPVKGYWDGEKIAAIPFNKNDIANEKILADRFEHSNFVSAQTEIREGNTLVSGDGVRAQYGMMIISEATFQSLGNIPRVTMFCGKYDPDKFIKEMNQLVDHFVNSPQIEDRHLKIIEDIFCLKAKSRSFFGELDLKVPFGANFQLNENRSAFSAQMVCSMEEQGYLGRGLIHHLEQYGQKPEGFDEHMRGLYEANYISEAVFALTRTFQPSVSYSGEPNPATNMQLLTPAIKREMDLLIHQQQQNLKKGGTANLDVIDDIINKMKKDLAEMVKNRNELAKAIGNDKKGPGIAP